MKEPIQYDDLSIEELISQAEADLIKAPAYLKDSIMKKSQSMEIQIPMQVKKSQKVISKQVQMLYYTLKVSAAVVCTVVMLLFGIQIQNGINSIKEPIRENSMKWEQEHENVRENVDQKIEEMKEKLNFGGRKNER
ncbi:MAG: hypothetical protein GX567_18700 [Clostridia bacterium]|nr:hypothetical protein [Clostridia bacterium]